MFSWGLCNFMLPSPSPLNGRRSNSQLFVQRDKVVHADFHQRDEFGVVRNADFDEVLIDNEALDPLGCKDRVVRLGQLAARLYFVGNALDNSGAKVLQTLREGAWPGTIGLVLSLGWALALAVTLALRM